MSADDSYPPSKRVATHLLDELESIEGMLASRSDIEAEHSIDTEHSADFELPADIPLLDDMVIHHLNDNAQLLNIEQIFDEDTSADETPAVTQRIDMQFPRFTLDVAISDDDIDTTSSSDDEIAVLPRNSAPLSMPPRSTPPVSALAAPPAPPARVRPDYSREVLIQELVDEFIPQIEAELHKRLQQLNDGALRRLKDPK